MTVTEGLIGVGKWALMNPESVVYMGGVVAGVIGWLKHLKVSNKAEANATIRSAAANAGGRILMELATRPRTESLEMFILRRISEEAIKQTQEFSKTGKIVNLDAGKMSNIILGQMGQNPVVAAQGIQLPVTIPTR